MSEFTLRIVFDGICAYVPTVAAAGDGIDKATGMVVAMVDGALPANGRRALDGSDLKQHLPFIRCPLDNLASFPKGGLSARQDQPTGIWYLNRQRVTFKLDPPPGPARFITSGERDIRNIPEFSRIVPDQVAAGNGQGHNLIDPRSIARKPPASNNASSASPGVIAQVLVDSGTIGSHKQEEQALWEFSPTLTDQAYRGQFAARVAVEIPGLTSASLMISSFDNGDSFELPLRSSDGKLEVIIANVCDDNPLDWRKPNPNVQSNSVISDPDMKWLYFLCQGSQVLRSVTSDGSIELPVPVRVGQGGSTGSGGRKCFGCLFEPIEL